MTVIAAPAARSPKYAAALADREAARRRRDLAYRSSDPALYANLVDAYRELGFDVDGYPIGYPQHLKTFA
ncbi:hypothetical protein ABZ917_17685 [Nonomuraea wenchangensis]